MFLLVPAHPGSPGQRAVKQLLCALALQATVEGLFSLHGILMATKTLDDGYDNVTNDVCVCVCMTHHRDL